MGSAMTARRHRLMRQTELVDRVRNYDPQADENLLNKAYVFGLQAHGPQKRASGDPYFSHPLEVAGILTDLKLDTATIVTALLHDTVEDTTTTIREVGRISAARSRPWWTASPSFRNWRSFRNAPSRRRISAS
jgi:(p)ppGpp synthase/HD superfamily hydrolase